MDDFVKEVNKYNITIRTNELLSRYTTLKIGGPAKYFVYVRTVEELQKVLEIIKFYNEKLLIIGAGSNMLISDKGFDGVVIKLKDNFCHVEVQQQNIIAYAGVMLPMLIKIAIDNSLAGLEDLFGIPGTLGGAVIMNAGVNTATISDHLEYIEVIDIKQPQKGVIKLTKNEIGFDYRKSGLEDKFVVVSAMFKLNYDDQERLRNRITEVLLKRLQTQPLGTFNAGCIFKNPKEGTVSSAKLIEECGLKGYAIGDAYVSEKHANFIINKNNATADDFIQLIRYIIKTVKQKFGVELEPEIKIIGLEI